MRMVENSGLHSNLLVLIDRFCQLMGLSHGSQTRLNRSYYARTIMTRVEVIMEEIKMNRGL